MLRVFVAGASGVIGRPLVQQLVEAGHAVVAMTRTPEKAELLRQFGAEPVVCDALVRDRLVEAVVAAKPEVVVHQLTALPDRYNPRRIRQLYRETDRLHIEGTDNLLTAAREAAATRFVVQSVAFSYERSGGPVKTEDAPLDPNPPKAFADAAAGMAHLERTALSASDVAPVVLRYGFFYGPGTWYAPDGHFAREVRRRRYPIVGHGEGIFSFIHLEDAASATRLAIESDVTGVLNIVDDEPAPMREWVPVFAAAVGAPRPWSAPVWLARLVAGRSAVDQLLTIRGADNAKAKAALGWKLRFPSWRVGFDRQLEAASTGSS